MTVSTQTLSAITAITFDISSLATSSTLLAGRESGEVSNVTPKYVDALVNVAPILGHASTPPVVGQYIGLWLWGSDTSLATRAIDVLDGTESNETLTHAGILNGMVMVRAPAVTVATAGLAHLMMPFSVAAAFGGKMPNFWGLFLAHNHAGALAASQSALFNYQGVTYETT